MGFLPGRNVDIHMFSLFCHAAEELSLYLVPAHLSPAAVSQRDKRQTEASSHPFHPSLPIYFLFMLFLSLLAGPD